MPITRLDTPTLQTGDVAAGTVSPAAGSNRLLLLFAYWEKATRPLVQLEIGGQNATKIASTTDNAIGGDVFMWTEAQIAAMADSNIDLQDAETYVGGNVEWSWLTLAGVNQSSPYTTFAWATGSSVTSLNISANACDYGFLLSGSPSSTGTFTSWGTDYTELLDGNVNGGMRYGLAEASAGRGAETATITSSIVIGTFKGLQIGFNAAAAGNANPFVGKFGRPLRGKL